MHFNYVEVESLSTYEICRILINFCRFFENSSLDLADFELELDFEHPYKLHLNTRSKLWSKPCTLNKKHYSLGENFTPKLL